MIMAEEKVRILRNGYTMDDAARRLRKRSKGFSIEDVKPVLYPYIMITYEIDMGEKLKKLNDTVYCLVDLYTGRHSLAKSKGKYVSGGVDKNMLMPANFDREELIENAPKEIYGEIMARKRVIKIPDINYKEDKLFYKPFYVVECKNKDEEVFHILFDAVSGSFSLLNA